MVIPYICLLADEVFQGQSTTRICGNGYYFLGGKNNKF